MFLFDVLLFFPFLFPFFHGLGMSFLWLAISLIPNLFYGSTFWFDFLGWLLSLRIGFF